MEFKRASHFKGRIRVPRGKSISHRTAMLGSVAQGLTKIHNFLQGADCLSIVAYLEKMGVSIENKGGKVLTHGRGLYGLNAPWEVLDYGNSGTITRLISGILCSQNFDATPTGDESTCKRLMRRVMESLVMVGVRIASTKDNGCAPLLIEGGPVHDIHYDSRIASAQVKSTIMLTGLYTDSPTGVTEPYVSRSHSELMLRLPGIQVSAEGATAVIKSVNELHGSQVMVLGDISFAVYFVAGSLMIPGLQVLMRNAGISPARDGILRVCRDMGVHIEFLNINGGTDRPTADILVYHGSLHGTVIGGSVVPTLIGELPVIAAMACFVEGETVTRDVGELRVGESSRIAIMVQGPAAMGADMTEIEDGMIIRGGAPLHGAVVDSRKDHRITMTSAVTALCADGITEIRDANCVDISYPGFCSDLKKLTQR